jgi:hypothetical protein
VRSGSNAPRIDRLMSALARAAPGVATSPGARRPCPTGARAAGSCNALVRRLVSFERALEQRVARELRLGAR